MEAVKPLVSVIVPVYNVEKYVEKCLDSIQKQTFKALEIIVVDDGSTDRSLEIVKEIAKHDERIIVYHKENGGLSSARNYGIDQSTAQLISFVDSDDYLDSEMIELLYDGITNNDADISMCTIYDVYPGVAPKQNDITEQYVVGAEEAIKIVLEAKITSVYAVAKLYKKELFKSVRYPEGKLAEDAFVIVDLLDQCGKVYISNAKKYYYIHRENSITTSDFKEKHCDVIKAYKRNYSLISQKYPNLQKTARMRVCWAHFFVLDKLATAKKGNKAIENEIVNYLRKNFFFILKNDCFTSGRKIAMLALLFSKMLYKKIVKSYIVRRGIYA